MEETEINREPGSPGSLERLVLLRLSEVVTLVVCLREKAYNCRRLAQQTVHDDMRQQAMTAARRLEERATQLAQENAPVSDGSSRSIQRSGSGRNKS